MDQYEDLNLSAIKSELTSDQFEEFIQIKSCLRNVREQDAIQVALLALINKSGLGGGGGGTNQTEVRQIANEEIQKETPRSQFRTLSSLTSATNKIVGETYTVWDDPSPENNGVYDYVRNPGGPGTGNGLVKVGVAIA